MSPDRFNPDETELTVESLLLKSNGRNKTANDVFEVVVAAHHDAKKRDALILTKVDKHLSEDVRMTHAEFADFMDKIAKRRDEEIKSLENDILLIQENCKLLHVREPRRSTDPETEDWGNSFGDEAWEIKKAWRFLKYVVYAVLGTLCVVIGEEIASQVFHLK